MKRLLIGTVSLGAAAVLGTAAGVSVFGDETPPIEPTNAVEQTVSDPWSSLAIDGLEVETFDDLAPMARSANVAAVAKVLDVQGGRDIVDTDGKEVDRVQFLTVTLAVEEVLQGAVVDGAETLRLEFGPFDPAYLASRDNGFDKLVGSRGLFLLRLKGAGSPEGLGRSPEELARKVYRVVTSNGLFTDSNGRVGMPLTHADDPLAKKHTGRPFADVVSEVKQAG